MRGPTVSYKDDPLKKQMFPQDDQPALKKTKTVNTVVHPEKKAKECLKYLTFRHVNQVLFTYQYFEIFILLTGSDNQEF